MSAGFFCPHLSGLILGIICIVWLSHGFLLSTRHRSLSRPDCHASPMELRRATLDDVDDIVDLVCAAFPMDPQWNYRLRWRSQFPEITRRCTREEYKNAIGIDDEHHFLTNLITAPSDENHHVREVIAIAVWEQDYLKDANIIRGPAPGPGCTPEERKDMDVKRDQAFMEAVTKGKEEYFDRSFGNRQLHLMVLATHPKYQGRGAGSLHCQWGISLAKDKELNVTLFASPMGEKLYLHLGFKIVGNITVQVDGEDEKLHMPAMVLGPSII